MMVNWFAVALGTNIKAKRQSSLICCESRLTDDIYYMNRINFLHVFGYFRICEPLMMISLRFCYSFPLHSFILLKLSFLFRHFQYDLEAGFMSVLCSNLQITYRKIHTLIKRLHQDVSQT
jgi:hypothetical protein